MDCTRLLCTSTGSSPDSRIRTAATVAAVTTGRLPATTTPAPASADRNKVRCHRFTSTSAWPTRLGGASYTGEHGIQGAVDEGEPRFVLQGELGRGGMATV